MSDLSFNAKPKATVSNAKPKATSFNAKPKATVYTRVRSRLQLGVKRVVALAFGSALNEASSTDRRRHQRHLGHHRLRGRYR